jgi:hypothetical protein
MMTKLIVGGLVVIVAGGLLIFGRQFLIANNVRSLLHADVIELKAIHKQWLKKGKPGVADMTNFMAGRRAELAVRSDVFTNHLGLVSTGLLANTHCRSSTNGLLVITDDGKLFWVKATTVREIDQSIFDAGLLLSDAELQFLK